MKSKQTSLGIFLLSLGFSLVGGSWALANETTSAPAHVTPTTSKAIPSAPQAKSKAVVSLQQARKKCLDKDSSLSAKANFKALKDCEKEEMHPTLKTGS